MNSQMLELIFAGYIVLMLGWLVWRVKKDPTFKHQSSNQQQATVARYAAPFSIPYLLLWLFIPEQTKESMAAYLGIFSFLSLILAFMGFAYFLIDIFVRLGIIPKEYLKGKSLNPLLLAVFFFCIGLIVFFVVRSCLSTN